MLLKVLKTEKLYLIRRKSCLVDDAFISQHVCMSFNYEIQCIFIPAMYISKLVLFICYSPDMVKNAFPNAKIAKLPKSVGTMNKVQIGRAHV